MYGIAEPVRRGMEMKIVREGEWRPAALGGSKGGSVHEDILALGGRETEVTWEDVFHSMFPIPIFALGLTGHSLTAYFPGEELREPPSFHDEMENRLKMNQ